MTLVVDVKCAIVVGASEVAQISQRAVLPQHRVAEPALEYEAITRKADRLAEVVDRDRVCLSVFGKSGERSDLVVLPDDSTRL